MPGNIVKINNSNKLSWYVGDSKLVELMEYLNKVGFKEGSPPKKPKINTDIEILPE